MRRKKSAAQRELAFAGAEPRLDESVRRELVALVAALIRGVARATGRESHDREDQARAPQS